MAPCFHLGPIFALGWPSQRTPGGCGPRRARLLGLPLPVRVAPTGREERGETRGGQRHAGEGAGDGEDPTWALQSHHFWSKWVSAFQIFQTRWRFHIAGTAGGECLRTSPLSKLGFFPDHSSCTLNRRSQNPLSLKCLQTPDVGLAPEVMVFPLGLDKGDVLAFRLITSRLDPVG